MVDEILEISYEKSFELDEKLYDEIEEAASDLIDSCSSAPPKALEEYKKKMQAAVDKHRHDFLNRCKREKPVEPVDEDRISVDWS